MGEMLVIIALVCTFLQLSLSIKLECQPSKVTRPRLNAIGGSFNQCGVKDLVSVAPGLKVDSVVVQSDMAGYQILSIVNAHLCFFIPTGITQHFKNLEIVEIDRAQLVNISNAELKQFASIRELRIENTNIAVLEGNVFKYNTKLELLSLRHNKIKQVDAGTFKPLKKLTELDFTFNECFNRRTNVSKEVDKLMDRIEEECKAEVHEVNNDHDNRTIKINCIAQLNRWTLFGHVKECWVSDVISTSTSTAVEGVNSSTSLDVIKSFHVVESPYLYFLPSGLMTYLKGLEILFLEDTQLVSIKSEDLKPFVALRGLIIDNSNLTTLEEDLFKNNEKLEMLALTRSKIKSVASGAFKSLKKLFDFDFRFNPCFNRKEAHLKNVEKMIEEVEDKCKGGETKEEAEGKEVKSTTDGEEPSSKELKSTTAEA